MKYERDQGPCVPDVWEGLTVWSWKRLENGYVVIPEEEEEPLFGSLVIN